MIKEYKEKNIDNKYKPVAVGRYGIRKREDNPSSQETAFPDSKFPVIATIVAETVSIPLQ